MSLMPRLKAFPKYTVCLRLLLTFLSLTQSGNYAALISLGKAGHWFLPKAVLEDILYERL